MDPPEHSRLRRLLSRSFTPRAVARLEDRIRGHARAICDRTFTGPRGECDFAKDVAADLPLLTLADTLGVPEQDRWLLFDWSNRVIGYQDPDYASSADFDPDTGTEMAREALSVRPVPDAGGRMPDPRIREGMPDLYAYAHLLAEQKRRRPGDDVMSILLAQADEGGQVSVAEFENMFWLPRCAPCSPRCWPAPPPWPRPGRRPTCAPTSSAASSASPSPGPPDPPAGGQCVCALPDPDRPTRTGGPHRRGGHPAGGIRPRGNAGRDREAGIGKSRLVGHMSAVAAKAGVRVVTGRALPAGTSGPLGPVAEVIMAVTRDRPAPSDPDLAPYLAVLASVVPPWREPGRPAPAEPVLVTAEAVLRVLLNELGTVEMLRDARSDRLEQARAEALRIGAVGLATGIGANLAALLAMTARFDDVMKVAGEVERSAERLGLVPIQAAALLMHGFALAHQGRSREMERYLGAAEALAPDDADLRAGAWGIGRALNALLAEDRNGARLALARARQEAPDQHARILNPYEGPELLLRALAGEAGRGEIDAAAAGIVRAARWPELWFGAAQAVVSGTHGDEAGASAALAAALDAASRYPVFSALVKRLVAEAAVRDQWGEPGGLLLSADATFTRLRLGRASAACRALLKAAGQPAPRRRAAEAGLPAPLVASGVTAREAEVLDLVGERLSNREIAQRLFVSPRTVEKHVAALLAKLGTPDRGSLAQLARGLR